MRKSKNTRELVRAGLVGMKSYKAMAIELGVSESNIKYHAGQIYRSMGLWGTGARLALALEGQSKRKIKP